MLHNFIAIVNRCLQTHLSTCFMPNLYIHMKQRFEKKFIKRFYDFKMITNITNIYNIQNEELYINIA